MKLVINGTRLSVFAIAFFGAVLARAQSETMPALKEVVVSANRFAETANSLPFSVGVITARDIEVSGAASISEALMKLLGLPGRLDTSGGNNYAVDLRGFGQTSGSNQVVFVDGRRLNDQDLSGTNLGVIPIDTVQRIEVIRGSAAVLYGEGATGGVIVITTKAGLGAERRNAAIVAASVGSDNFQEVRTNATLASGGLSLDISASDRRGDGHRNNFSSTINGLGATVQWSNDWLRVGTQASRSMQYSGLPGPLTAADYASDPRKASDPLNYARLNSEIYGVFIEAFVDDWQLGLDYGERVKKQLYFSPTFERDTTINATSTNLRARHAFNGSRLSNVLAFGVDLGDWKFRDLATSRADAQSSAVYLTNDVTYLASGTRLSLGLRNEEAKKTKSGTTNKVDELQTAWHVGLTQELSESMQVYGRTGQSFRFANADEFSFIAPGGTLKPQTSRDLELGARWQNAASRAEIRWYRSELNNEIGYDETAFGPSSPFFPGANVNFDPTRRAGVELEGRHELSSSIAVRGNVAYRQARFVSGQYANKDVALVPAQTAGLGIDWTVAAGHQLNMGITWVSSQSPDFANKCSMPAYSTVDARYAYSTGMVELALGVRNLGDSKYYTQAFGCTAGVTTSIYPEAGRAWTATAKVNF